jgi:hypothetical protein
MREKKPYNRPIDSVDILNVISSPIKKNTSSTFVDVATVKMRLV